MDILRFLTPGDIGLSTKVKFCRWAMLLVLLVTTVTCVDPFNVNVTGDQPNLIIEGQIHNGPGPYQVRMFRSIDIINPDPETNAVVTVSDDLGNEVSFNETIAGTYQSDPSFQAQVGRSYTLNILTSGGDQYQSTPQTILAPVSADDVYLQAAERLEITQLGNEITINGFEVLVDTKSSSQGPSYFRWDYRGVYQFITPDPCTGCTERCYARDQPSEFIKLFSTTETNVPVRAISMGFFTPTIEFESQYTMFIRQFRLNQDAFDFWEAVESQRTNTGTIFDPPPGIIVGNVVNLSDQGAPPLGLFETVGLSEIEFVITRTELVSLQVPFPNNFTDCDPGENDPPAPAYCSDCLAWPGASIEFPIQIW